MAWFSPGRLTEHVARLSAPAAQPDHVKRSGSMGGHLLVTVATADTVQGFVGRGRHPAADSVTVTSSGGVSGGAGGALDSRSGWTGLSHATARSTIATHASVPRCMFRQA